MKQYELINLSMPSFEIAFVVVVVVAAVVVAVGHLQLFFKLFYKLGSNFGNEIQLFFNFLSGLQPWGLRVNFSKRVNEDVGKKKIVEYL